MMNFAEYREAFGYQGPRSVARQDLVRQQVEKLIGRLQRIGVRCEVGSTPAVDAGDVQVLIQDAAGLRDFRLWEIAWDEAPDAEVTLVFMRHLGLSQPGQSA